MKIMQEMTKIKDKSKQMAWRTVIKTKNVCARAGEQVKNKLQDESGIGVVEVILILVVLIGLVIIFKTQLTNLVNKIFEKITSESSGI